MNTGDRLPWVWDYHLSEEEYRSLLTGERTIGLLNQRWAAVRLIEYAPYREIVTWLGFPRLVANWPQWRSHVRSRSRRRGLDFLAEWIPEHHPELLR